MREPVNTPNNPKRGDLQIASNGSSSCSDLTRTGPLNVNVRSAAEVVYVASIYKDGVTTHYTDLPTAISATTNGTETSPSVLTIAPGIYLINIVLPAYTHLVGFGVTIQGSLTVNDGCVVKLDRLIKAAATDYVFRMFGDNSTAHVDINEISLDTVGGDAVIVMDGINAVLYLKVFYIHKTEGVIISVRLNSKVFADIFAMSSYGAAAIRTYETTECLINVLSFIPNGVSSSTALFRTDNDSNLIMNVLLSETDTAYAYQQISNNLFVLSFTKLAGNVYQFIPGSPRIINGYPSAAAPAVNEAWYDLDNILHVVSP